MAAYRGVERESMEGGSLLSAYIACICSQTMRGQRTNAGGVN